MEHLKAALLFSLCIARTLLRLKRPSRFHLDGLARSLLRFRGKYDTTLR